MKQNTELKVPNHIAMVMDGNGRWAQSRSLRVTDGHKKGAENLGQIIEDCINLGIKHLTFYAFSTENWNRSQQEVGAIMTIVKFYLKKRGADLIKNGIKLNVIGNFEKVDKGIAQEIHKLEEASKNNDKLFLNIAFSYGGRQEIVDATKKIAKKVQSGLIKIEDIDEDLFKEHLYNKDMPYPDLIIRTGGDQRISNFLIWQLAYSEFYFTKTYWPDFHKENLIEAIKDFNQRKRTYGRRKEERKDYKI